MLLSFAGGGGVGGGEAGSYHSQAYSLKTKKPRRAFLESPETFVAVFWHGNSIHTVFCKQRSCYNLNFSISKTS